MGRRSTKQTIAAIWARTLNCAAPGPDSDFFESGGDSIVALNMLFEIGEVLGVELSPVILFENPSFGALVAAVSHDLAAASKNRSRGRP
jgi:acyl carrier protein